MLDFFNELDIKALQKLVSELKLENENLEKRIERLEARLLEHKNIKLSDL